MPFVKTNAFSATTAPKHRMSAATSHGKYNKFKPDTFVPTSNEKFPNPTVGPLKSSLLPVRTYTKFSGGGGVYMGGRGWTWI